MKALLTTLIISCGGLFAVEGKITYLSGSAEIRSGGKAAAAKLGTNLKEGAFQFLNLALGHPEIEGGFRKRLIDDRAVASLPVTILSEYEVVFKELHHFRGEARIGAYALYEFEQFKALGVFSQTLELVRKLIRSPNFG